MLPFSKFDKPYLTYLKVVVTMSVIIAFVIIMQLSYATTTPPKTNNSVTTLNGNAGNSKDNTGNINNINANPIINNTGYIYQDTDNHGNIIITNKPTNPNAKKINLPSLTVAKQPMTAKDINNINTNINYSADNSSEFNNPQNNRRHVLQEELASEVKALQDTMRMLEYNKQAPDIGTDPKSAERIKIIEESVHEHQKNIAILNNSLNNWNN
jgi:DNA-binding XRE family transcriptional regulator